MRFNLPDDYNKEEINFRYLKDVIPAQLFLRIFYKEVDGRLRPLSADDVDVSNRHINSEYEVTTVLKQMTAFTDLMTLYGDRLTSLSSNEFANYVESFVFTNAYKYGNLLLTEMQNYGMIDNYDKKSTIKTEYAGAEYNDTKFVGEEYSTNTKEGIENIANYKGGQYSDTSTRTGDETHTNGLTQTTSKNATNNSANLTVANKVANTGDDTTTYNSVKDERIVNYGDIKTDGSYKEVTEKWVDDNFEDKVTKSFSDSREDKNTKSFSEDRADTVTEKTSGNIGVTTTAQMLQGERELSDFSVFKIMFEDIVKSVSVML